MKKYMIMTMLCLMHMVSVLGASSSSSSSGSSSSNPTPTGYLMCKNGVPAELNGQGYTEHIALKSCTKRIDTAVDTVRHVPAADNPHSSSSGESVRNTNIFNDGIDFHKDVFQVSYEQVELVEVPYSALVPYLMQNNDGLFRPRFNAGSWKRMLFLGFGLPIASWYVAQRLKLQQKYACYAGVGIAAGLLTWAAYRACVVDSNVKQAMGKYVVNAKNYFKIACRNDKTIWSSQNQMKRRSHFPIAAHSEDDQVNMEIYNNLNYPIVSGENDASCQAYTDNNESDTTFQDALFQTYGPRLRTILNNNNKALGLSAGAAGLLCAYVYSGNKHLQV